MKFYQHFRLSPRKFILLLFDMLCFAVVTAGFYLLSHYSSNPIDLDPLPKYLYNSLILFVAVFLFRYLFGTYLTVWRYTSSQAYFRMIMADITGSLIAAGVSNLCNISLGIWFQIILASLNVLLGLTARFTYRLLYKHRNATHSGGETKKYPIAIVGAGQLGVLLAAELKSNANSPYRPACFLERKKEKIGQTVSGIFVYDEKDAKDVLERFHIRDVILAISGLNEEDAKRFYETYGALGCKVKLYASPINEIQPDDGTPPKRVIREFEIEDLLFRNPLTINDPNAFQYYSGKTLLVTGGGGSIGSELCRQIARCHPKKLIIFDIYENNAYEIEQELKRIYGNILDLVVEIGSVRDRKRLESVFRSYRPDVVFHAAAHKHVPLMEHSGCEAIKNNVVGTYNTADMSEKYGVQKFILISTDKAVNPTNIMGASKRLCEMVVQCRTGGKTVFAAVRFGNVLGSNGSVIPLFKRQIASGGPVTITDKRIIRYFMTIPEASQLVMHAGSMAKNGELFVLNMGKPVRIYDLACNMIKLSGYVPEKEIQIKEIGLRPGEKLYEELLMKTEQMDKTNNDLIFIEHDKPLTRAQVDAKLAILSEAVRQADENQNPDAIKQAIARVVPTYRDPKVVNQHAEETEEMKTCSEEKVLQPAN